MAEFEEGFQGKEDVNIVQNETCEGVSAKRKHYFGVTKMGNKWRARIRDPKLKGNVHLGHFSTPEEAALAVKNKKAELNGEDGCEFEGRKLSRGVRRDRGKFRVRIWLPELKRDASFGAYSTYEEAAVVAEKKRAELRESYGGKLRGSSECEDDDKVLQETESEEAAVIADKKRAELQELYGGKPRGSSECEDDDKVLLETESEEAVVADMKRAELHGLSGGKPRGSSECEDDDTVLLETEIDEAAVIADKKSAEFEEQFKGKEDMNIVENEICDGVSGKRKQFWGVCKKGNKWRAKIRHPKLKAQVHLGCYSTPEEAALVVKKKKAEFQETLNGEDGLRMKRRRDEFQGCKLPSGVRSEGGMFRVRMWHPVLKRDASFGAYSTCEEAAVVADRKKAEIRELYVRKSKGSSECEDDYKVLQETESEEAAVIADRKRAKFEEQFKGKEDMNTVENETCDGVSAKRKQFLEVSKKGNKRQVSRVEKSRRHEFEGRQLPKGVTRECGKFRVRLWHPELNKYASFGYYSSCDEAVVVADRKKAELQEVYQGKRRGSSECEDDDMVLQETESEEAAVVADMERAEFRDVYGGKVRGSGVCEEDDEEVLQETTNDFAGNFECSEEQASDVTVPASIEDPVANDRIWLGTYDTLAEANRCFSKEKTVLDTEMKRAEFEEQFKGKEDVNVVEDETCEGVLAKTEHFLGVSKKGNKWEARVNVHLGNYRTPEEAALVVKNKKAEFEETLKGVDGLWKKRPGRGFEGTCGIRRDRGKFRVRIWHPELKKDISFGAYSTYEEAVVVADRKRAELRESYGGKPGGSSECEDDDKVLRECETSKGGDSH